MILIIFEIKALELEKPLKVPIEIDNTSDYGVTVILGQDRGPLEFDILASGKLTNMVGKLPAVIECGTTFRIITAKGHFAIEYAEPILFKHVYDKGGASSDVPYPKIFLAGLQKIYATILSDGVISLKEKKVEPSGYRSAKEKIEQADAATHPDNHAKVAEGLRLFKIGVKKNSK